MWRVLPAACYSNVEGRSGPSSYEETPIERFTGVGVDVWAETTIDASHATARVHALVAKQAAVDAAAWFNAPGAAGVK